MDNHESLMSELITGYQAYADTADLELSATASAPATTVPCSALASFGFSYVTTNGPG